jgi:NTP pyrophosphatase (non-canonical NTP hydrolase)
MTAPGRPVPFTLTPKAHAALDHDRTATPAADLRQIARHLDVQLRANRRPAITDASALDVQALCVAEEAGELVGAYRRWAGKARRTGTRRELEDEVADVLIVTAVFAERAGIDLDAAIAAKLTVIYSRGWREEDDTAAGTGQPVSYPAHLRGIAADLSSTAGEIASGIRLTGRACPASVEHARDLLAILTQIPDDAPRPGEWDCKRCGEAWFGTPPEDGLCPACRAAEDDR